MQSPFQLGQLASTHIISPFFAGEVLVVLVGHRPSPAHLSMPGLPGVSGRVLEPSESHRLERQGGRAAVRGGAGTATRGTPGDHNRRDDSIDGDVVCTYDYIAIGYLYLSIYTYIHI